MRKKFRQILATLLVAVMLVGVMPVGIGSIKASAASLGSEEYTFLWPVKGVYGITSPFVQRYFTYMDNGVPKVDNNFHYGVDFQGTTNKSVVQAMYPGKVINTTNASKGNSGHGTRVVIYHEKLGLASIYCHMKVDSVSVSVGQSVNAGTELGIVGNTGNSQGGHVHVEVYRASSESEAIKLITATPSVTSEPLSKYKRININPVYGQKILSNTKAKESSDAFVTVYSYQYKDKKQWNGVVKYVKDPSLITGLKPTTPTINVSRTGDVAVGDTVTVSWASQNATSYDVTFTGAAALSNTTKTSQTYTLSNPGTYSVTVNAKNSSGTAYAQKIAFVNAHSPSTVTFKDYNGNVLNTQKVKYNASAIAPDIPSREGYTFTGWDKGLNNIKSDTVITAQYKINTYKIKFVDYNNNTIKEQTVTYLGSVTPPDESSVPLKDGYVFKSWDSTKYNNVKEDATIRAIYTWGNTDLPIIVKNATAQRDEDGYMIKFDLTNYPDARTSGRAVVALKTAEGKLIETTESSAFSIAKSATKTAMEVYCPTQEVATKVEVIIVDSYSSGVPISESLNIDVTNGLEWSNWSFDEPAASENVDIETRTVYRYLDKQKETFDSPYVSGWTYDYREFSKWGTTIGPVNYDPSNGTRNVWSKNEQTGTTHYYNYFQCYSGSQPGGNNKASDAHVYVGGKYCEGLYEIYIPYKLTNKSGIMGNRHGEAFWYDDPTYGRILMWYYNNGSSDYEEPVYSKKWYYQEPVYTYHFYKWDDSKWSSWGTTAVSANADRQVEPRTQYRIRNNFNNAGIEDVSGSTRTFSANFGTEFKGKQVTLYIYKIDEASDWTNEFVGQGTIADDGSFSMTYKLREEPSVKTGDFTVAVGIEGTNNLIVVDTIVAPKPTYTVNFYDSITGELISTQQVTEGDTAELPENPEHTGYTFVGWSGNITNVRDNLDLQSRYKIDTYAVTFVDWETQTIEMREFDLGQLIIAPDIEVPEGKILTGWTNLNDGDTASKNMVCEAVYENQTFEAVIHDSDDSIIETQTVEYGDFVELPESCERNKSIFYGWLDENGNDLYSVSTDLEIYPVFVYEDTTENPVSSVKTGVYDNNQTITLSCPTSGAEIRYTTEDYVDLLGDSEYYEIYDGPITLDYSANLRFVAVGNEMNPSEVITETIAINNENNVSPWMVYDDIPAYVFNNLDKYILEADTGYKYKDTVTVSSVSEKESLLADGWTLVDFTLGQPSDWSFDVPELNDVDYEISSQKVSIDKSRFKYTHYKYYDDAASAYAYSDVAVEGTDGEWEEYICENKLSISGFVSGTTVPFYNYNGQRWFNQESIKVPVEYTMYSYQIKNYNLYKHTEWTTEAPSADETREYATDTVYQFTAPKMVIVNVVDNDNIVTPLLALYGMPADLSDIDLDVEGYTIEGYYTDKDFNNEWDINTPVTESITLYPKYEVKTFTVKFLYENGTVIDTQTVNYGDSANAPEDFNIEDGYAFVKWSNDSFDNVTSDMNIVAIIKPESEITKVVLNKQSFSTTIGSSVKLTATVTPDNLDDKSVSWESSDASVAEIDSNGYVTAVSAGEAVITATAFDGTKASCTITVMPDASTKVAKIQLSENDICIVRYTTKQLTATVLPETSVNKKVVWTSSNDKIASVDENGIVTGNMAGTAIITATSQDGGYKDYCLIKVIGINALSTASIDFDSGIITGLAPSINSLDKYLSVSDDSCQITFDTLGTDSIVYITRDNEIVDAYTVVIFGDVNGDGVYDGMDAMIVSCLANGMLSGSDVGEAVYMAADCNHDGVIDSLDVDILNQAGVLLADVDQSKSEEELLETSSVYVQYLNLIQQSPETETTAEEVVEDTPTADDKEPVSLNWFQMLVSFLKTLLNFVYGLFTL